MILVVDIGTSSVRAAAVDAEAGELVDVTQRPFAPSTPAPGLVEFDPADLASTLLDAAEEICSRHRDLHSVAVTAQRASTVVWDRSTGVPIGPGLGWQDLRTVVDCLTARAEHQVEIAPNQTATKAAHLIINAGVDPASVLVGTIDAWAVWTLTRGASHITDHTNAAVTGLYSAPLSGWDPDLCAVFGIDPASLPTVVDSFGDLAVATALSTPLPIRGLVGDQQSSMVGQACVRPGVAKITFGTGGMLDMVTGADAPTEARRAPNGCFPIVGWSESGEQRWGLEAVMLAAGSNVEWLRDDLGLIATSAESHDLASRCADTEGVVFVPAPLGLGTPAWDYGARGTLLGLTRGTDRTHIARAVLEGVANRGADLVEAAEADSGVPITDLRVDGGMSRNPTFLDALADATSRPVEVSPQVEATTLGAARLAAVAGGVWPSVDSLHDEWAPLEIHQPSRSDLRDRWQDAVERSRGWIPSLSALDF